MRVGVDAQTGEQLGVELRLDGADRHVPAVGAGVGAVEGGGAVEEVGRAAVLPGAGTEQAVDHRDQRAGAVHHGRVDHLAAPARLPLEQGGEHADDEEHRAAAEVGADVERRDRRLRRPDGVQGAGEPEVVDVVPGAVGERAVLAPAGHPRVDQPRVAGESVVGADAEPLGDARAQPLDQHVGALHQPEDDVAAGRALEVDGDRGAAAVQRVPLRGHQLGATAGPVDPDDVGAQLGQQQAGVGGGAETGQLDDAGAREGAGGRQHGTHRNALRSTS